MLQAFGSLNFSNLRLILIAASYVLVIALAVYLTARYKDGQYALQQQKMQAQHIAELKSTYERYNQKIKELNQKALAKQAYLSNLNSELERKYARANKKIDEITAEYHKLISSGWRLRDPGKTDQFTIVSRTTENSDSTATTGSNRTTCSAELSEAASRFLLSLTAEADKVVEQLVIAQNYAMSLKRVCEQQEQQEQ